MAAPAPDPAVPVDGAPHRSAAVDGVRGWAAAMVFWAHSVGFHAWGGSGVWLFFMLSGFLLFRPFVDRDYRFTARELAGYAVRRLLRIWPLLCVALPVYAWLVPAFGGWSRVLPHLALVQADMHFWTVKQELLFYAVLPLFVVACRRSGRHALPALAALAVGSYFVFDHLQLVQIPWQGIGLKFRVVPFVIGMAIAVGIARVPAAVGRWLLWAGLLGLGFASSSAVAWAWGGDPGFFEWERPYLLWPFAAAFLVGAVTAPQWIVANPVARGIGVLGYGIYVWHFGVILVLKAHRVDGAWWLVAAAGSVTLLLAAASWRWIERPAIRWGQRLSRRIQGAGPRP